MKPVTIYTIAFDRPGGRGMWAQARLLAASLMRTKFRGQLIILRNTPDQVLDDPRITEVEIDTGDRSGKPLIKYAQWFKFHAAAHIPKGAKKPDQIIAFSDCDCLFLRDPSKAFNAALEKGDLAYVTENRMSVRMFQFRRAFDKDELNQLKKKGTFGVNSGCWAVPGDKLETLLCKWRELHHQRGPLPDQNYFNRIIHLRDGGFAPVELPKKEFTFPEWVMPRWQYYKQATHLHCCGIAKCRDKIAFMLGIFESSVALREEKLVQKIQQLTES